MMDDMREAADLAGEDAAAPSLHQELLQLGQEPLRPLATAFAEAREALAKIAALPNPHYAKRAAILLRQLDVFEPSVTIVGQVKAGKTALTNALIGQPGLLPSDVNPWTSVVTNLHLNAKTAPEGTKAEFTFFDKEEWARLMTTGGRMGELAERAGAEDEVARVNAQIQAMHKQSMTRLGDQFELLLGKTHRYPRAETALIERYVCLGEIGGDGQLLETGPGRFADITKSAELFLDRPEYPGALCLRDTPGVNDTFMVREQITLRALRGSDICLVVLSAPQALNTSDMALVRLISNFEKRQILLFVNRIDELAKPSEQVPEIRDSIRATLKARGAAADCEILFGSARWAEAALTGAINDLPEDSQAALFDWAETLAAGAPEDPQAFLWALSGLPDLYRAMNARVLEGPGRRLLENVRARVANLTAELAAEQEARRLRPGKAGLALPAETLRAEFDALAGQAQLALSSKKAALGEELTGRLAKLQQSFTQRALESLIAYLEKDGQGPWTYDATGLRVLLRSAYFQFAAHARKEMGGIFAELTEGLSALYARALGQGAEAAPVLSAPPLPQVPAPVVVGQTLALDMSQSWWRRWWGRRRGAEAIAADYESLLAAEVGAVTGELQSGQVNAFFAASEELLAAFVNEQREALDNLCNPAAAEAASAENEKTSAETQAALGAVLNALETVAA